jgi:lipoprotein-releasing system permease protein
MDASFFIASRMRFKGRLVVISIAISYLVMLIALSVSSGFRHEIRDGLSDLCGDIQLTPQNVDPFDGLVSMNSDLSYLSEIEGMDGVDEIRPVIYRAGMVKCGENIHGVLFKGVQRVDTVALGVSIPRRLSELTGLKPGDRMPSYFVGGEKVRMRQFTVTSVYDAMLEADDRLVVYASLPDMQRLNSWSDNEVSGLEIMLDHSFRDEVTMENMSYMVGAVVYENSSEQDEPVYATSSVSRYRQLFDWLAIIDFNVLFILVLMTIVAGFNMISGLLIMLFENISTIGLLKSLGMRNVQIINVYLTRAAGTVFKGMLIGNLLAIAFCLVQNATHFIPLDPVNYYVSYIPVHIDLMSVLCVDFVAFVVIMLLLLLPSLFVLRVDPAKTLKKD